jgi:hypothetical protein
MLESYGCGDDQTYFDVDLFLSGSYVLAQGRVVEILEQRVKALRGQLAEAEALRGSMSAYVPAAGRLIMDHRIAHLGAEIEFCRRAARSLRAQKRWGAYLGTESIASFVGRTGVALESASRSGRSSKPRARKTLTKR